MANQNFDEVRERSYRELGDRLRAEPAMIAVLPDNEEVIARMIADGLKPYEIAMAHGISEDAVWTMVQSLSNAIAAPSRPRASRGYETAGMGSDTDPGVTGGYGDTGFGAIGNEPPEPITEEPEDVEENRE